MRGHQMKIIKAVLLGASLGTTALVAPSTATAQGKVTITSFGGSFQEAQRNAYFEPFAKETGIGVLEDEWHGEMAKLRAMVQSGNVTWDVVDISDGQLPLACDEGLVERLDPADFGGKDNFLDGWVHPCGMGVVIASIVIGYNADKFPGEKPSKLVHFWDVKRFPGPRAMKKWPKHNLEFALLADGVPPDKIYDVLGTEEGVARAFAKLDEIKPHVKVWFTSWAEPGQLLTDGEVVMSTGTNGRLAVAAQSAPHVQFTWDRQGYAGDYWAIVKGAKNRENAIKFIRYASQPKNAARLPQYILYAPPVPKALDLMPPDVAKQMPIAPKNLETAWVVNSRFWGDHLEDYELRFQTWLAQ